MLWNYIKLHGKKKHLWGKIQFRGLLCPFKQTSAMKHGIKTPVTQHLGVRCGCFELHHTHILGMKPASLAKWGHSRAQGSSGGTEPSSVAPVISPPFPSLLWGNPDRSAPNHPKSSPDAMLWAISRATAASPCTYISQPQKRAVSQLLWKV